MKIKYNGMFFFTISEATNWLENNSSVLFGMKYEQDTIQKYVKKDFDVHNKSEYIPKFSTDDKLYKFIKVIDINTDKEIYIKHQEYDRSKYKSLGGKPIYGMNMSYLQSLELFLEEKYFKREKVAMIKTRKELFKDMKILDHTELVNYVDKFIGDLDRNIKSSIFKDKDALIKGEVTRFKNAINSLKYFEYYSELDMNVEFRIKMEETLIEVSNKISIPETIITKTFKSGINNSLKDIESLQEILTNELFNDVINNLAERLYQIQITKQKEYERKHSQLLKDTHQKIVKLRLKIKDTISSKIDLLDKTDQDFFIEIANNRGLKIR